MVYQMWGFENLDFNRTPNLENCLYIWFGVRMKWNQNLNLLLYTAILYCFEWILVMLYNENEVRFFSSLLSEISSCILVCFTTVKSTQQILPPLNVWCVHACFYFLMTKQNRDQICIGKEKHYQIRPSEPKER